VHARAFIGSRNRLAGHEITMPFLVPPKKDATCLVHLNGVAKGERKGSHVYTNSKTKHKFPGKNSLWTSERFFIGRFRGRLNPNDFV
jgi:hypothetical protein